MDRQANTRIRRKSSLGSRRHSLRQKQRSTKVPRFNPHQPDGIDPSSDEESKLPPLTHRRGTVDPMGQTQTISTIGHGLSGRRMSSQAQLTSTGYNTHRPTVTDTKTPRPHDHLEHSYKPQTTSKVCINGRVLAIQSRRKKRKPLAASKLEQPVAMQSTGVLKQVTPNLNSRLGKRSASIGVFKTEVVVDQDVGEIGPMTHREVAMQHEFNKQYPTSKIQFNSQQKFTKNLPIIIKQCDNIFTKQENEESDDIQMRFKRQLGIEPEIEPLDTSTMRQQIKEEAEVSDKSDLESVFKAIVEDDSYPRVDQRDLDKEGAPMMKKGTTDPTYLASKDSSLMQSWTENVKQDVFISISADPKEIEELRKKMPEYSLKNMASDTSEQFNEYKLKGKDGNMAIDTDFPFLEKHKQSHMYPLEMFDQDVESDPDHEQLISDNLYNLFGYSKYYLQDQVTTIWKKCRVLAYNPTTRKFTITFDYVDEQINMANESADSDPNAIKINLIQVNQEVHDIGPKEIHPNLAHLPEDAKVKQVSRLNMRYLHEDEGVFSDRIKEAERKRIVHEALCRYSVKLHDHESNVGNQVLIATQRLRKILQLVGVENFYRLQDGFQSKQLIKEFLTHYRYSTVKFTFDYKFIEQQRSAGKQQQQQDKRVQQLEIKNIKSSLQYYLSILDGTRTSFPKTKSEPVLSEIHHWELKQSKDDELIMDNKGTKQKMDNPNFEQDFTKIMMDDDKGVKSKKDPDYQPLKLDGTFDAFRIGFHIERFQREFKKLYMYHYFYLEKAFPARDSVTSLIFPKIIRHIKGLGNINFYQGFFKCEESKVPVRVIKLEKVTTSSFMHEFKKIKNIVYTAENTVFTLMNDQLALNPNKNRKELRDRYDRFVKISNIFFESNLHMAIDNSIALIKEFFQRYQKITEKLISTVRSSVDFDENMEPMKSQASLKPQSTRQRRSSQSSRPTKKVKDLKTRYEKALVKDMIQYLRTEMQSDITLARWEQSYKHMKTAPLIVIDMVSYKKFKELKATNLTPKHKSTKKTDIFKKEEENFSNHGMSKNIDDMSDANDESSSHHSSSTDSFDSIRINGIEYDESSIYSSSSFEDQSYETSSQSSLGEGEGNSGEADPQINEYFVRVGDTQVYLHHMQRRNNDLDDPAETEQIFNFLVSPKQQIDPNSTKRFKWLNTCTNPSKSEILDDPEKCKKERVTLLYKPYFSRIEDKIKELIIEHLTEISKIEYIKFDFLKESSKKELSKVLQEFEEVFQDSMVGPIGILAVLKQYDYLIMHEYIDYIPNIQYMIKKGKVDLAIEEVKHLQEIKCYIQLQLPKHIPFGLFSVSLSNIKQEFIESISYLTDQITHALQQQFRVLVLHAKTLNDQVHNRLTQDIQHVGIFIDLKIYIEKPMEMRERIDMIASQMQKLGFKSVRTNPVQKQEFTLTKRLGREATYVPSDKSEKLSESKQSEFGRDLEEMKNRLDTCTDWMTLFEEHFLKTEEKTYTLYLQSFTWSRELKKLSKDCQKKMEVLLPKFRAEILEQSDKLQKQIFEIEQQLNQFKDEDDTDKAELFKVQLQELSDQCEKKQETCRLLNQQEDILGVDVTDFSKIDELIETVQPFKLLWESFYDWKVQKKQWMEEPFINIDREKAQERIAELFEIIEKLKESFMPGIGNDMIGTDEFDYDEFLPRNVVLLLKNDVQQFSNETLPVIVGLRNEVIKPRHWDKLREEMGLKFVLNPNEITLQILKQQNIQNYPTAIQMIKKEAEKEHENEIFLDNIRDEIKHMNIQLIPFKSSDVLLIQNAHDKAQILQDFHFACRVKQKNDKYIAPFEERVKDLLARLHNMRQFLNQIDKFQINWTLLYEAFRIKEVQKFMISEHTIFTECTYKYQNKAKIYQIQQGFLQKITEDDVSFIKELNVSLKKIKFNFKKFLFQKRTKFPRFYLLSDQQLLNLICSQNSTNSINEHAKQCFQGICSQNSEFIFTDDDMQIIGCIGLMKETLNFIEPVQIRRLVTKQEEKTEDEEKNQLSIPNLDHKPVETIEAVEILEWMYNLEQQIQLSIQDLTKRCLIDLRYLSYDQWLFKKEYFTQIYSSIGQVKMYHDISRVFKCNGRDGLIEYLGIVKNDLVAITQFLKFDKQMNMQQSDRLAPGYQEPIVVPINEVPSSKFDITICDRSNCQRILKEHSKDYQVRQQVLTSEFLCKMKIVEVVERIMDTNLESYDWVSLLKFCLQLEIGKDSTVKSSSNYEQYKELFKSPSSKIDVSRMVKSERLQTVIKSDYNTMKNIYSLQCKDIDGDVIEKSREDISNVFLERNEEIYDLIDHEDVRVGINGFVMNITQEYGFEFVPQSDNAFIITPLTEKTIFSLMNAIANSVGGMISGGVGSGKTETINCLASQLARPYIKWSCRGGSSYQCLSNIFAGIAMGGIWLCLDEINELNPQLISTISQLILSVRNAIYEFKETLFLDDDYIKLNRNCAIFSTFTFNSFQNQKQSHGLNQGQYSVLDHTYTTQPSKCLQENFKITYMVKPDLNYIIRLKLLLLGFTNATELTKKIICVLQMINTINSNHTTQSNSIELRHVNILFNKIDYIKLNSKWLKAVKQGKQPLSNYLIANGLRGLAQCTQTSHPQKSEEIDSIIYSVFKCEFNDSISFDSREDQLIQDTLFQVASLSSLCVSKQFCDKSRQINNTQSKGILVVGPSGSGKSELIKTSAKVKYLLKNEQDFNIHWINVNGLHSDKFIEIINSLTQQCQTQTQDSNMMPSQIVNQHCSYNVKSLQVATQDKVVTNQTNIVCTKYDWIVFDGAFNQSMNQNLDWLNDNSDALQMIIETSYIQDISPGVLSRVQIVSVDEQLVDQEDLFKSFIEIKLPSLFKQFKDPLTNMFKEIFLPVLDILKQQRSHLLYYFSTRNMVLNFISVVDIYYTELLKQIMVSKSIDINQIHFEGYQDHNYFNQLTSDFILNFKTMTKDDNMDKMLNSERKKLLEQQKEQAELAKQRQKKNRIKYPDAKNFQLKKVAPQKEKSGTIKVGSFNSSKEKKMTYGSQKSDQTFNYDKFLQNVECAFIESIKFMCDNITGGRSSLAKRTIGKQLEIIMRQYIDKYRRFSEEGSEFAYGILNKLEPNNKPHKIFTLYFDFASQTWELWKNMTTETELCTFSGIPKLNLDQSFTEKFRLDPQLMKTNNYEMPKGPLMDKFLSYDLSGGSDQSFIYVPVSSLKKNEYFLKLFCGYQKNVLLFGPPSSGKSSLLKRKINVDIKHKDFLQSNAPRYIQFIANSGTTIDDLKLVIERNMEVQRKGLYSPPSNQHTYVCVEDLNMGKIDGPNGAHLSPIELIREYMNVGGWYSKSQPRFNRVLNLGFIATQGRSLKHRNQNRRHFIKLHFDPYTLSDIKTIFKKYLKSELDFRIDSDDDIYINSKPALLHAAEFFQINANDFDRDKSLYAFNFTLDTFIKVIQDFLQINVKDTDEQALGSLWVHLFQKHLSNLLPLHINTEDLNMQISRHESMEDKSPFVLQLQQLSPEDSSNGEFNYPEKSQTQVYDKIDSIPRSAEYRNLNTSKNQIGTNSPLIETGALSNDGSKRLDDVIEEKKEEPIHLLPNNPKKSAPKARRSGITVNVFDESKLDFKSSNQIVQEIFGQTAQRTKIEKLEEASQPSNSEQSNSIATTMSSDSDSDDQRKNPKQFKKMSCALNYQKPIVNLVQRNQEYKNLINKFTTQLRERYELETINIQKLNDTDGSDSQQSSEDDDDFYKNVILEAGQVDKNSKEILKINSMVKQNIEQIFQEETDLLSNDLFFMEDFQYNKLVHFTIELIRQLSLPQAAVFVQKDSTPCPNFIFTLASRILGTVKRVDDGMESSFDTHLKTGDNYTPLYANTAQPSFSFDDLIREFSEMCKELILMRKKYVLFIINIEDYMNNPASFTERQVDQINELLCFAQAINQRTSFKKVLNSLDLRNDLEKYRPSDGSMTDHHNSERLTQEQFLFMLCEQIHCYVKILFIGGKDSIYNSRNKQPSQTRLHSCDPYEILLRTTKQTVNLGYIDEQLQKHPTSYLFKNPFKIHLHKYEHIIETVYAATAKLCPQDIGSMHHLQSDKIQVIHLLESLLTNYYQAHKDKKSEMMRFFKDVDKLEGLKNEVAEDINEIESKKVKIESDKEEAARVIEDSKKMMEQNLHLGEELFKKSQDKFDKYYADIEDKGQDANMYNNFFNNEMQVLIATTQEEYEDFQKALDKGARLYAMVCCMFVLMFNIKLNKSGMFKEEHAVKFFAKTLEYSKFKQKLTDFNLDQEFDERSIMVISALHEEAKENFNAKTAKQFPKFIRSSISWFINGINYIKAKASYFKSSQEANREIMVAEDERSIALFLIDKSNQRQEDVKKMQEYIDRCEKKIAKFKAKIEELMEKYDQLKNLLESELLEITDMWKGEISQQLVPFKYLEGNYLYQALVLHFQFQIGVSDVEQLKEIVLNVMLDQSEEEGKIIDTTLIHQQRRLQAEQSKGLVYKYINMKTKEPQADRKPNETDNFHLSQINSEFHQFDSFIAYLKLFNSSDSVLPFPIINDPMDVSEKYITQMEKQHDNVQVFRFTEIEETEDSKVNLNTCEHIRSCMENGNPMIFKDIDEKMFRLIEPLIKWKQIAYQNCIRHKLGQKYGFMRAQRSHQANMGEVDDFETTSNESLNGSSFSDDSDSESQQNKSPVIVKKQSSNNLFSKKKDQKYENIVFNKRLETVNTSLRIYIIFTNDKTPIPDFIKKITTCEFGETKSINQDTIQHRKEMITDSIVSTFQYEPLQVYEYLQTVLQQVKEQQQQMRDELFESMKDCTSARHIDNIKRKATAVNTQDSKLFKDVIEGPFFIARRHIFDDLFYGEKDQCNITQEESETLLVPRGKARSPTSDNDITNRKKKEGYYYINQMLQNGIRKYEDIILDIMHMAENQVHRLKSKLSSHIGPIMLCWTTMSQINPIIGDLYSLNSLAFKLMLQMTNVRLHQNYIETDGKLFEKVLSSDDLADLIDRICVRQVHKIMTCLRKDHQILFSYAFSLNVHKDYFFEEEQSQRNQQMVSQYITDLMTTSGPVNLPLIDYQSFECTKAVIKKSSHKMVHNYKQSIGSSGKQLHIGSKDEVEVGSNSESEQAELLSPQKRVTDRKTSSTNFDNTPDRKKLRINQFQRHSNTSVASISQTQVQDQDMLTDSALQKVEFTIQEIMDDKSFPMNPQTFSENNDETISQVGDDSMNQSSNTANQIKQNERMSRNFFYILQNMRKTNQVSNAAKKSDMQRSKPAWLPNINWKVITEGLVVHFPDLFRTLPNKINMEQKKWKNYMQYIPGPYENLYETIPGSYSNLSPTEKLLLLYVLKTEQFNKCVSSHIKQILDEQYAQPPLHSLLIHSLQDWQEKPTIVYYTKHSQSPVQLIMNASQMTFTGAKKEAILVQRLSCGEGSFDNMKTQMINAARSGKWLIIENINLLPNSIARLFIRFLYDEIIICDDTFEEVKIWITYEVESEGAMTKDPRLSDALYLLICNSFKLFINPSQNVKENIVNTYETTTGPIFSELELKEYYIIAKMQEEFEMEEEEQDIMLPSPKKERGVMLEHGLIAKRGDALDCIWEQQRKIALANLITNRSNKSQVIEMSQELQMKEFSIQYRINFLYIVLQLKQALEEEQLQQMGSHCPFVYSDLDIQLFVNSSLYYLYSTDKGIDYAFEFLEKNLLNFFGIECLVYKTFSHRVIKHLFDSYVLSTGIKALQVVHHQRPYPGKGNIYMFLTPELYSKKHLSKIISLMPEQDAGQILGVCQNTFIQQQYKQSKEMLQLIAGLNKVQRARKPRDMFGQNNQKMIKQNTEAYIEFLKEQCKPEDVVNKPVKIGDKELPRDAAKNYSLTKRTTCRPPLRRVKKVPEIEIKKKREQSPSEKIRQMKQKNSKSVEQKLTDLHFYIDIYSGIVDETIKVQDQHLHDLFTDKKRHTQHMLRLKMEKEAAEAEAKRNQNTDREGILGLPLMKMKVLKQDHYSSDEDEQKGDHSDSGSASVNSSASQTSEENTTNTLKNLQSQPKKLAQIQVQKHMLQSSKNEKHFLKMVEIARQLRQLIPAQIELTDKSFTMIDLELQDINETAEDQHDSKIVDRSKGGKSENESLQGSKSNIPKTKSSKDEMLLPIHEFVIKKKVDLLLVSNEIEFHHSINHDCDYIPRLELFDYTGHNNLFKKILKQEVFLINKLITLMKQDVDQVLMVLQGKTSRHINFTSGLFNYLSKSGKQKDTKLGDQIQVPVNWYNNGFFCSKKVSLNQWQAMFMKKYMHINNQVQQGQSPDAIINLQNLFNPFYVLYSFLLDFSYKHAVPLYELSYVAEIVKIPQTLTEQIQDNFIQVQGIIIHNASIQFRKNGNIFIEPVNTREFKVELPPLKLKIEQIRNENFPVTQMRFAQYNPSQLVYDKVQYAYNYDITGDMLKLLKFIHADRRYHHELILKMVEQFEQDLKDFQSDGNTIIKIRDDEKEQKYYHGVLEGKRKRFQRVQALLHEYYSDHHVKPSSAPGSPTFSPYTKSPGDSTKQLCIMVKVALMCFYETQLVEQIPTSPSQRKWKKEKKRLTSKQQAKRRENDGRLVQQLYNNLLNENQLDVELYQSKVNEMYYTKSGSASPYQDSPSKQAKTGKFKQKSTLSPTSKQRSGSKKKRKQKDEGSSILSSDGVSGNIYEKQSTKNPVTFKDQMESVIKMQKVGEKSIVKQQTKEVYHVSSDIDFQLIKHEFTFKRENQRQKQAYTDQSQPLVKTQLSSINVKQYIPEEPHGDGPSTEQKKQMRKLSDISFKQIYEDKIPFQPTDKIHNIKCQLVYTSHKYGQFDFPFELVFKSYYPQSYWDSHGLVAYFQQPNVE